MPRSKPSYRLHKATGQAIVTLPDANGGRRDVYLGKYNTPESRAEYDRVLAEWQAQNHRLAGLKVGLSNPRFDPELTINELADAFWPEAEKHYRHPDGTPTGELHDFRLSFRPLKYLYGHTRAIDFGPLALKAIREAMISGSWLERLDPEVRKKYQKARKPACLSRGVINQRIGRIRRMFKWGVENELIPATVLHALQAVKGLQRGRTEARETEPVKPVPEAHITAILPALRPQVADMVLLQFHTGMRPGELCRMRTIDLDTSGQVWFYNPANHKTQHHGHARSIPLGPKAQEIVKRHLKTDLHAFLFSPRQVMADLRREQRQNRKTKVQPSQLCRRRARPERSPGDSYPVNSYATAIRRACIKQGVPHFHPHQIRHTKATEIRRAAGLDAARVVLGHRSPKVTEVYAEIDTNKAAEVAARLG
jgi:integrase